MKVVKLVRSLCKGNDDAFQDSMVMILTRYACWKPELGNFATWIRWKVKKCLWQRRRVAVELGEVICKRGICAVNWAIKREERRLVASELTFIQGKVLFLIYFKGLTLRETGFRVGLGVKLVRKHRDRGLATVERLINLRRLAI